MDEPVDTLKKILLVDPDQRSRDKSALRLALLDLVVLKAASPREALELMESEEPHLVVTDWPLAGVEDASLFHEKLKRSSLPVIFCGLEGSNESRTPTRASHAFVDKQNRQEFIHQVSRLLSERSMPPLDDKVLVRRVKSPRQILVIEDSPTLRGIIRRALEKAFPLDVVREAEEGKQALSEMSQKKVDLIVTDLEMPGMDGFTFLNHLKSSPLLSKKPVLIFSGKISPELKEQASPLPKVRFLSKPADPEKIVSEVAGLLEM
ncbi:MAG TPA: response regulator [bacterium]|nr:response regulator [bacterium]